MALTQTEHLNLIQAEIGQVVGGPAPSNAYFAAVINAIIPYLPTWYTFAQSAVMPDAAGNFTFDKVLLIDLITRRLGLLSLLAPLAAKIDQTLDGFLIVHGQQLHRNVLEGIRATEGEIEVVRKRIRDSRTPVLAEILRLSPVRTDMPIFPPGAGQPVLSPSTTQPDPNDQRYVGAPVYDSTDPNQPLLPGPLLDQPGQPEGW